VDQNDELGRARDFLDLEEGRGPVPILDDQGARELLRHAKRIAVVGASPKPHRTSYGIMRYLLDAGFECVPINPNWDEVLGQKVYRTVVEATEATGRFDIVDVFRRSELTEEVARDAVAAGAGCLWLQVGVVNWEAARIAYEGGLTVVMDRCTMVEHRVGARG
jgi:predicted CoA-binding protein